MEKFSIQSKYSARGQNGWEAQNEFPSLSGHDYCETDYKEIGFKNWEEDGCWKKSNISSPITIDILGEVIRVPYSLKSISNVIKESKFILSLEEGWDEDKAMSFSKEIWGVTAKFLLTYAIKIYDVYDIVIEVPEINPCPDATIDLSWRTSKARLLINIRDDSKGPIAYFYGDLKDNCMQIKGNVPCKKIADHLMVWMKNLTI